MSEREPQYEAERGQEVDTTQREKLSEKNFERMRKDAEKAEKSVDSVAELREKVGKVAKSNEELTTNATETNASESSLRAGTQLKSNTYKRTLASTQRKLKPTQRAFSKIIHQPVVEAVSDAAEGTVARPSGLLFAGLFSALSSLIVLYVCLHYGYEYNFMIGLISLGIGFIAGILLEGLWRLVKR